MPYKACDSCGASIGTRAKRCRYCGFGEPGKTVDGYLRVFVPGHPLASTSGHVLEHRYVLHEAGVPLPDECDVHHVNGDKTDNRLKNLVVILKDEHARHHANERGTITNQFGVFPVQEHGVSAYQGGRCRCDICRQANTDYCREQRRRRRERERTAPECGLPI